MGVGKLIVNPDVRSTVLRILKSYEISVEKLARLLYKDENNIEKFKKEINCLLEGRYDEVSLELIIRICRTFNLSFDKALGDVYAYNEERRNRDKSESRILNSIKSDKDEIVEKYRRRVVEMIDIEDNESFKNL
ncbi:MAG: hypothetical protein ABIL69_11625 [candidate division WOR-3 bacterium]